MLYSLLIMDTPRSYWPKWAATLRRYQMDAFAASLLEAGGPLSLISAQALYLSRPFWGGDQVEALARTLESDEEVRAFAVFLSGKETK